MITDDSSVIVQFINKNVVFFNHWQVDRLNFLHLGRNQTLKLFFQRRSSTSTQREIKKQNN